MIINHITNDYIQSLHSSRLLDDLVTILMSVNEDYTPSLFQRIPHGETLEEKVRFFLQERIDNGYSFYVVLNDENDIVAFNNHVFRDEIIHGVLYRTMAIGTTAVLKCYQNIGIGKDIYNRIESDSVHEFGVDVVVRTTWSTNEKQIHLYDKFGYQEYGREKDGRGVGVDGVHFYKVVNKELRFWIRN